VYQAFPCSFSPGRAELRAALAGDLVGSWSFRSASMKLRQAPSFQRLHSQLDAIEDAHE
jgi:hypothetical protein